MPVIWFLCDKHDPPLVFSHVDTANSPELQANKQQCPKCQNEKIKRVRIL